MTTEETSTEINPIHSLECEAGTDIGLRREENQDSYGIIESENFRVYFVADGMGGVQGGAIASQLAVSTIKAELGALSHIDGPALCSAIVKANQAIFEKGLSNTELTGMGTTVVLLAFIESKLLIASVGDSRAYRLRDGEFIQLTEDHTLVNELVKAGSITEDQAENHPVSHMLTRSLGPTATVEVDCFETVDFPRRDDIYMLCSDGLYNMVHPDEAAETIQSTPIEKVPEELISFANMRGGVDNITVIVVRAGEAYPPALNPTARPQQESAEIESPQEEEKTAETTPDSIDKDGNTNPSEAAEFIIKGETDHFNSNGFGPQEQQSHHATENTDEDPFSHSEPPPAAEIPSNMAQKRGLLFLCSFSVISAALLVAYSLGTRQHVEPEAVQQVPVIAAPPSDIHELPVVITSAASVSAETSTLMPTPAASLSSAPASQSSSTSSSSESSESKQSEEFRAAIEHRDALRARIAGIEEKLSAFNQPISGKIAESLGASLSKISDLQKQADTLNAEIERSSTLLKKWMAIKKKLENKNPVDLAEELAALSPEIKVKQDAFQSATWEYLQEQEKAQQSATDSKEQQKIELLTKARADSIADLTATIHAVTEAELTKTDKEVADKTFQRDIVVAKIQAEQEEVSYAKVLIGDDATAREEKRQELTNDLARSREELQQLTGLPPESANHSEEAVATPSANAP